MTRLKKGKNFNCQNKNKKVKLIKSNVFSLCRNKLIELIIPEYIVLSTGVRHFSNSNIYFPKDIKPSQRLE